MISSLKVEGYRGFADYRVEKLAKVNLFVGKNNSGKTSMLEVIELLASSRPVDTLAEIAHRRNELAVGKVPSPLNGDGKESSRNSLYEFPDLSHLFIGHRFSQQSTFHINGRKVSVEPSQNFEQLLPNGSANPNAEAPVLTVFQDDVVIAATPISRDGFLTNLQNAFFWGVGRIADAKALYIGSESISTRSIPKFLNVIIEEAEEQRLVSALQIVDSEVTGVYLLATDNPSGVNGGILIGRNGTSRQPIDSFGEGFRRILALTVGFVNASSGVLLVDEVDTGIHYSAMPDFWKLIIESSISLNTQFFATTHSYDCLQGLTRALERNPSFAEHVGVHKLDRHLDYAITTTGEDLLDALESEVEMR